MAPTWLPMRFTMQIYCESYFAAAERWMSDKNSDILKNRLQLVETVGRLFSTLGVQKHSFDVELVCDNPSVVLLEAVIPSQGQNFVEGGDMKAFQTAQATFPPVHFQRFGMLFQDHLLKGISGYNQHTLDASNVHTRSQIIAAVEKLLRLPNEAGMGNFVISTVGDEEKKAIAEFSISSISEASRKIMDSIYPQILSPSKCDQKSDSSTQEPCLPNRACRLPLPNAGNDENDKNDNKSESTKMIWTCKHSSLGSSVAAMFRIHNKDTAFKGTVTRFCLPSSPTANDQLYHIKWEDNDEQDMDESEFQTGVALYRQLYVDFCNWTTDHPSVNTTVASYFKVGKKRRLFSGKVERYCFPSHADAGDQLYHVRWEDNDQQDMDEKEYAEAVALAAENHR